MTLPPPAIRGLFYASITGPGRPIIRKGGAVVGFDGAGLKRYRRPGRSTHEKPRPVETAGVMTHHTHQAHATDPG